MFRCVAVAVVCLAPVCLAPFAAQAQSFVSVDGAAIEVAAPLGPPVSIMQRYVPHTSGAARDLSLLIDESANVAQVAPRAAITVTGAPTVASQVSGSSLTTGAVTGVGDSQMASSDLLGSRKVIVVSSAERR